MLVEEFLNLNIDERANFVWAEGEHVTSIFYYQQIVVLYALPNFFVEVYYDPTELKIGQIEPIQERNPRFKLYLNSIDLEKMLNL